MCVCVICIFILKLRLLGHKSVYVQGPWRAVWSYRRRHERCMERNTLFSIWVNWRFLMGLRQICL